MRAPHLQTLRVLDAAARLGSYTRAAEELGLTHGAVSHRIRALEAELGLTLFVRQGNGMMATPEALRLLVPVREALALLASAFPRSRRGKALLRVSLLPSFASRWLMPRIGAFRSANPDVDLRLDARLEFAPLGGGGVDCAIRYGMGPWPGADCRRLAGERIFPVTSPDYRDRHGLRRPVDLAHAVLLRHDRQLWAQWLRAAGLRWPEPADGAVFSDAGLLLDAAVAGEGVALGRARLVEADIANGRLVPLFSTIIPDGSSYYLVKPPNAPRNDPLDRFEQWLCENLAD